MQCRILVLALACLVLTDAFLLDYGVYPNDYEGLVREQRAPLDRSAMVRFGKRAPLDRSAMVRFGKRAPLDRSAMVRFGRAPLDRSAMVRFGKRAPLDRSAMVRFGKRDSSLGEESLA